MAFERVRPELSALALLGATSLAACNLEVNIHLGDSPDEAASPAPSVLDLPEPPPAIDPPEWAPMPNTEPRSTAGVIRDALLRPEDWAAPVSESTPREICESPTFTPFTVAPVILNREDVVRDMMRAYPRDLRAEGVGGTVRVYFCIASDGQVANVQIDKSSGVSALDEAAMEVAGVYRFRAAKNRDETVTVWVSFPITFQVR